MTFVKLSLFIILFLLSGCSDYPSGYREGYEGNDKKQWIVFGRSNYSEGFYSGQAERFQYDWLLENPIEDSLMQCPSIVERADPLMFLPSEYKEIAPNVYSSEFN